MARLLCGALVLLVGLGGETSWPITATATAAAAQEAPPEEQAPQVPATQLRLIQLLRVIEVDAQAIRDGNQPLEDIQREAYEIRAVMSEVPALISDTSSTVVGLEVALREAAAHLADRATAQDVSAASRAADDVLVNLIRLRQALGIGGVAALPNLAL